MDREETLRRAEKLLRQGRLDAAIAEYARVVEDQPADWTTANLLGDLYVRAGQTEAAVAQYSRIADQLAREGFVSKATALYKKIVKIHPDDQHALLRAAELAAQQGLSADARGFLQTVFQQRMRRADRIGAARVAVRLADVDPNDAVGRLEAARMLAELGESAGAAEQLRLAGQVLTSAGKVAEGIRAWREALRFNPGDLAVRTLIVRAMLDLGDPDGARDVARAADDWQAIADALARAGREADAIAALEQGLAANPADDAVRLRLARASVSRGDHRRAYELLEPSLGLGTRELHLALADVAARAGRRETVTAAIDACLSGPEPDRGAVVDAACAAAQDAPDVGFSLLCAVLRRLEATGEAEAETDAIERFLGVVPAHVAALERLVELAGQSIFEDQRYRAQVRLADAYLSESRWEDARTIAEQLLDVRPDDARHRERLAHALTGLGVPNPAAVVQARLRRLDGADDVVDLSAMLPPPAAHEGLTLDAGTIPPPETAAVPAADLGPWVKPPVPAVAPEAPPVDEPLDLGAPSRESGDELDLDDGALARLLGPAIPQVFELDLSDDLESLLAEMQAAPEPPPLPDAEAAPAARDAGKAVTDDVLDLDGFFEQMRHDAGRDTQQAEAAHAYDLASEQVNRGDYEGAVASLRVAVRDPDYRFRAASMLARLARLRGRQADAIEWLERAAEAPAPSLAASHALLYDLGDALASAGEQSRALAIFLELQAAAPTYRDVATRIDALSSDHPGSTGVRKGSA
jgi:tetratricopeptide (TPR) repeat protein